MTMARAIPKPSANPSTGDAFLDAESSIQDSEPRELIEITYGTTTHRIATATRDIVHGGNLYVAIPSARGELGMVGTGNAEKEMTVTLPIDHELCRRWTALGVPPKKVDVSLWRLQGANVERLFVGVIQTFNPNDEGTEGQFRVLARAGSLLLQIIPNVTVDRRCSHTLYDSLCGVDRNGSNADGIPFKCTTTVQHVNGREVKLDLTNVPAANARRSTWLVQGELVHTASGERMTIREQNDLNPGASTVTVVTMQMPIVGIKVGDAIDVYAGCTLELATCHGKFANRANFSGAPLLPTKNPFLTEGVGA